MNEIPDDISASSSSSSAVGVSEDLTNGYGVLKEDIEKAWEHIEEGRKSEFQPSPQNTKPLIVIDPGHGVSDYKGSVSKHNGLREMDVADPVARSLADRLYAAGYNVAFTRNPGEWLRYEELEKIGPSKLTEREARAEFAHILADKTGHQSIYLVSLHANTLKHSFEKGALVFSGSKDNSNNKVDYGLPALDEKSVAFSQSIADTLKIRPGTPATARTADATVLTRFDSKKDSAQQPRVAVMIELGYLSNREDADILADMAENPDPVATQIAEGIIRYHQSIIQPEPDIQVAENTLSTPRTDIPSPG